MVFTFCPKFGGRFVEDDDGAGDAAELISESVVLASASIAFLSTATPILPCTELGVESCDVIPLISIIASKLHLLIVLVIYIDPPGKFFNKNPKK